jgi:hypothetical protein
MDGSQDWVDLTARAEGQVPPSRARCVYTPAARVR